MSAEPPFRRYYEANKAYEAHAAVCTDAPCEECTRDLAAIEAWDQAITKALGQ